MNKTIETYENPFKPERAVEFNLFIGDHVDMDKQVRITRKSLASIARRARYLEETRSVDEAAWYLGDALDKVTDHTETGLGSIMSDPGINRAVIRLRKYSDRLDKESAAKMVS